MGRIKKIEQLTDFKYLNMFQMTVTDSMGHEFPYYMASREKCVENLKISTRKNNANGVIIYSVYGEKRDKVVLVRQYRYPIDDYIYEFPAGLVEEGESFVDAGVRELKEETGLTLEVLPVPEGYSKPFYTTVGMTDEACGTVFGYANGEVSTAGLEQTEDLSIVLADKEEVRRILKEERVAIMCAYMLMHFLNSPEGEPFEFLNLAPNPSGEFG